jgi:hypothetical protein
VKNVSKEAQNDQPEEGRGAYRNTPDVIIKVISAGSPCERTKERR